MATRYQISFVLAVLMAATSPWLGLAADRTETQECAAGLTLLKSGKIDAALSAAQAILRKNPKCVVALEVKGFALMASGRYDEAALAFQAASRLEPSNAIYKKSIQECLEKQNQIIASMDGFSSSKSLLDEAPPTGSSRTESEVKSALPKTPVLSEREKYEAEMASYEDYGADGIETLVVVVGAGAAGAPGEPEPVEVSPAFVSLVKAGLRAIPKEFRDRFAAAGYRVIVVPDVSKSMSAAQMSKHPRGYPDGATFRDVLGFTEHGKRRIVLVQPPPGQKNFPDRTVCHEFGHCYDVVMAPRLSKSEAAAQKTGAWPSHSHTPKFKQAYDQDLLAFPAENKEELAYYLQSDQAGQEELFAEMFPLLYCKQPLPGTRLELLKTSFPNVLNEMRSALRAYD